MATRAIRHSNSIDSVRIRACYTGFGKYGLIWLSLHLYIRKDSDAKVYVIDDL